MHLRILCVLACVMTLFAGACSRVGGIAATTSAVPVVAVIDGVAITAEELLHKYRQTASGLATAEDDSAAVVDFLERYVNLRVKLKAAQEAGYYRMGNLMEELDGYRGSLGRPYLMDKEVMEPIIRDLFEKKQEVISVSHILMRLEPDTAPADTMLAYEKLDAIRDSVVAGADFGIMALRHSEDPSATISELAPGYKGFLGKFSAGRLVKPFEDMAYQIAAGEVSPVFRTQYGYHILLVHERTPMLPDIRVSHIMTRAKYEDDPDSLTSLDRILAVKARIDAGEPFEMVARSASDDINSASRDGDIGTLSHDAAGLDTAFANAAFALENVGDMSDVVESAFGYHLIKLTERFSLESYEDAIHDLRSTASRMPRVRRAEKKLADNLRNLHSVSVDTVLLLSMVEGMPRDSVRTVIARHAVEDSAGAVVIATFADSSYAVGQLASFISDSRSGLPNASTADEQMLRYADAFVDDAAISYAARQLEETDAEYAAMIREFEDGLVLFRFMVDSVWTMAESDSVGLAAHYADRKNEYRFPDRRRILQLYSRNDSLLTDAIARLDSRISWAELSAEISADSMYAVEMDTVLVEGVSNSIYDRALNLEEGERTEPVTYRSGKTVLFFAGIEPARAKTFAEARAAVITEHQQILEDRMIARLRARYAVQTFPGRLPVDSGME